MGANDFTHPTSNPSQWFNSSATPPKSGAAQLTLPVSVISPCEEEWDRTLDIASTWDKAKNGVRNGGAGRPRVARSDQHAESDRHHLDPTFDQVEGNSEKMQRGCAEKGLITIGSVADRQR